MAFLRWVHARIETRLAECALVHPTTHYFAQNGNDTTGDGSESNPWKTLSKVSSVIAASSGNIACLLRRGDTWRELTTLAIDRSNVALGAYGTGSKPTITFFTRQYAASGWTATGGGSHYHTESVEIAWVREVGDEYTPYSMATSAANCDATARSWWWDSGASRLYVNAGGGRNPNTLALEAVPHQTADAIFVDDVDGVRVDNIILHGGGIMSPANSTQHTYGFKTGAAGTNATVFADCECYYSGYHAFGQSALADGICTFVGCKSGFSRGADDGGFDFIIYAQDGGNECLVIGCTALYGPLPGTPGGAIYGHTAGGSAKHGLILESGFTVPAGAYAHSGARGYSDLPAASGDITAVRCFVLGRRVGSLTSPLAVASAAVIMCHEDAYHANSVQFVNCASSSGPDTICGGTLGNGWCVNCTLIINCTGYNPKVTSNQSGKRQRFWHCYLSMRDYASVDYSGFESASTGFGASAVDVEVHQSIFEGINGTIVPGINNNLLTDQSTPISPPQQTGNAYVGLAEPGYLAAFMLSSNDPRKLTLTGTPAIPIVPNASYIVAAGALTLVDYDAADHSRKAATVVAGPLAGQYARGEGHYGFSYSPSRPGL